MVVSLYIKKLNLAILKILIVIIALKNLKTLFKRALLFTVSITIELFDFL